MEQVPDFSFAGWIAVLTAFALAAGIPFWMIVRLPWVKRMARRAQAVSGQMGLLFWLLFCASYLLIVVLVFYLFL